MSAYTIALHDAEQLLSTTFLDWVLIEGYYPSHTNYGCWTKGEKNFTSEELFNLFKPIK